MKLEPSENTQLYGMNNFFEEIKNLYRFLQQIFPNKRVLKYALDYHSDLFEGGNPRKIALIYQGDGDNGKSIFQSVIEGMFGSEGIGYAAKLNTTFLSGKKQSSGGPQPDLDRLRHGCRLVVLQEPSKQEVINTALLKELTGNDTIYARTLYKEGGEFLPLFKPIIICNDLPQLSSNEPAIWSRLRILPFESKFPLNPEEAPNTYEEQLEQNFSAFLDAILRAKPSGIKGAYLKRLAISSTMGPGVRVDVSSLPSSPLSAN